VGPDVRPDVISDVGPDVRPDVISDVGPDVRPDTGVDAGPVSCVRAVPESVDELIAMGRDIENAVLARAIKFHLEHRVLINGSRTVVFR